MKHTKQTGILLAVAMLAGCCTVPFSASAEQNDTEPAGSVFMIGDMTCNGKVDVSDAVLAARFYAEDASAVVTDAGRDNGDVNADGNIDGKDIQEILEFIARKRTAFSRESAQQPPAEKLTKTVNMMDGLTRSKVESRTVDDAFRQSQYNLTANLMKEITKNEQEGQNMMISPLSFSLALSMTANGAKGNTLDELTNLLGGDLTMDSLNSYFADYTAHLPQTEKTRIDIANAIWFIDDDNLIRVPQKFLQTNLDYYDSDVYRSPFNNQTVDDINSWVKEKTNNMIPSLIDDLDPRSIMMLVNAVYFDAEWLKPYEEYQVQTRLFYLSEGAAYQADYAEYGPYPVNANPFGSIWPGNYADDSQSEDRETAGSEQTEPSEGKAVSVKLMNSTEHTYLENENMTGFMRPYHGSGYSFGGLLPKEHTSVRECIAGLDGETLKELFATKQDVSVETAIPKFSADYTVDLIPVMEALGVKKAFNSAQADFTGLNEYGETWINKALQKTRIEVDEKGTRAAAVTGIGMGGGAMMQSKEVILDHPFIYMIVDNRNEIPLFIGYVMKPEWSEQS